MKLVANKKTGIYQVHYRGLDGKRVRQSTGCTDREQAKRVIKESKIQELEETAKSGRLTQSAISYIMAGSKLTIDKAFEAYKQWAEHNSTSRYTYECVYLPTLTAWIRDTNSGSKSPYQVSDTDLNQYVNRSGPHKLATRRTWSAAFKNFWKFLSIKGWCLGNAALGIKIKETNLTHTQKETRKIEVFNDQELQQILDHAHTMENPFWYCAIAFGRYCGLRLGDIAQLQWQSFQDDGTLKVFTDKTDTTVILPLDHPILKHAISIMEKEDDVYCFPYECDLVRDPKRRSNLSVYFGRICERSNVTGKSFHCLRHTFATNLKKEGKLTPEIASWLGHTPKRLSPWDVTERYIHSGKE